MIIDCETCEVRGDACGDCVVAVLLGTPPVLGSEERRALEVLSDSGLIPPLRLVQARQDPVSGGSDSGPKSPEPGPRVTDDTPGRSTQAV